MHSGLIAQFNGQIWPELPGGLNMLIFCFPTQFFAVAIDQVIIVNALVGRPPQLQIPNGLHDRTGCQPGLYGQLRQGFEQMPNLGILAQITGQMLGFGITVRGLLYQLNCLLMRKPAEAPLFWS